MVSRFSALLLLSASVVGAQEVMAPQVVTWPDARPNFAATGSTSQGSMWIDSGGSSPLEKDFVARFFAEEGVVVHTLGPLDLGAYVNTTDSVDQRNLDWNRFIRGSGGMKLVKPFTLRGFDGLVRADVGYTAEHRFVSDTSAAAPSTDINYWVGWNPHFGDFPGSSWGIAGLNISPIELHNLLFVGYVKQGVVIWKDQNHGTSRRPSNLIIFGQFTGSKDIKHYDWNNLTREGGGVEFLVPTDTSSFEIGAMYLYETRTILPRNGSGLEVFIRFWHGWQDKR